MYDKKGGFPLKTTACAGGPPQDKGLSTVSVLLA